MTNRNPTTKPKRRGAALSPDVVLGIVEALQNEAGRVLAIVESVAPMFPAMAPRHVPGVLYLLGRLGDAVALAALLAKVSLEEDGLEPTHERIMARATRDYLTSALVKAASGVRT
jgi:hypothetical protein